MAISNCLFSPTLRQAQGSASENLLTHSLHFVLVSRGFCLRQFAALVSVWCILAKLSAIPIAPDSYRDGTGRDHCAMGAWTKSYNQYPPIKKPSTTVEGFMGWKTGLTPLIRKEGTCS